MKSHQTMVVLCFSYGFPMVFSPCSHNTALQTTTPSSATALLCPQHFTSTAQVTAVLGQKQIGQAWDTIPTPICLNNWLVVSTLLKNMNISWEYHSKYMDKYNMFQTTNQIMSNVVKS